MYDIKVKLWNGLGLIRGFDRCACDLWMDDVYMKRKGLSFDEKERRLFLKGARGASFLAFVVVSAAGQHDMRLKTTTIVCSCRICL